MKINLIVADQKNCMEIFEDEFLYFKITNRNFCIRSPSGIHGPCIVCLFIIITYYLPKTYDNFFFFFRGILVDLWYHLKKKKEKKFQLF